VQVSSINELSFEHHGPRFGVEDLETWTLALGLWTSAGTSIDPATPIPFVSIQNTPYKRYYYTVYKLYSEGFDCLVKYQVAGALNRRKLHLDYAILKRFIP
jgi:hypothetical protein